MACELYNSPCGVFFVRCFLYVFHGLCFVCVFFCIFFIFFRVPRYEYIINNIVDDRRDQGDGAHGGVSAQGSARQRSSTEGRNDTSRRKNTTR